MPVPMRQTMAAIDDRLTIPGENGDTGATGHNQICQLAFPGRSPGEPHPDSGREDPMTTFFSTRVSRRTFVAGLATATVVGARGSLTVAQAAPFGGGGQVESAYKYGAGPYAVTYNNKVYYYGTGTDGTGYSNTYDGATYTPSQAYPSQSAKYQGRPCAYVYSGKQYVYYYGQDSKYYAYAYDGQAYAAP